MKPTLVVQGLMNSTRRRGSSRTQAERHRLALVLDCLEERVVMNATSLNAEALHAAALVGRHSPTGRSSLAAAARFRQTEHSQKDASETAWTVMVYMSAGSDPNANLTGDIQQIEREKQVLPDTVKIEWTVATTGEPSDLEKFMQQSVKEAPAKYYALIMYGQGYGYKGFSYTPNGNLTVTNLTKALSNESKSGVKLSLLGFYQSLMAQPEMDYAVGDLAKVVVASEEQMWWSGFNFATVVSPLVVKKPKDITPEVLAKGMVQSYQNAYDGDQFGLDTLSAVLTDRMPSLIKSIKRFVQATTNKDVTPTDWTVIRASRNAAYQFDNSAVVPPPYRDLGQFMKNIEGYRNTSQNIHNAAVAVTKELNQAVLDKTKGNPVTGNPVTGLSVYLPSAGTPPDPQYPDEATAFNKATDWYSFIEQLNTQT